MQKLQGYEISKKIFQTWKVQKILNSKIRCFLLEFKEGNVVRKQSCKKLKGLKGGNYQLWICEAIKLQVCIASHGF